VSTAWRERRDRPGANPQSLSMDPRLAFHSSSFMRVYSSALRTAQKRNEVCTGLLASRRKHLR
jgi:hypothetical protein